LRPGGGEKGRIVESWVWCGVGTGIKEGRGREVVKVKFKKIEGNAVGQRMEET
jgi:hypothetical protein